MWSNIAFCIYIIDKIYAKIWYFDYIHRLVIYEPLNTLDSLWIDFNFFVKFLILVSAHD